MLSLVFVFAVLLIGCSTTQGDDVVEKITIGYVGGLSGTTASFGLPSFEALEYAVKEINENGGIDGKEVNITEIDDEGVPFKGQQAIDKFSSQDIHFVVSGSSSASALSQVSKVKENDIIAISPTATDPAVNTEDPYFFAILANNKQMGESIAHYAVKSKGYKEFISFVRDDAMGRSVGEAFKNMADKMGAKVVEEFIYPATAKDFSSYLSDGINKHPEAGILLTGYAPDSGLIAKQARSLGFNNMLFGTSPIDNVQYEEVAGGAADQTAFTTPYYADSESQKTEQFIDTWKEKTGIKPNIYQAHAYDAVYLIKNAIESAGSFDIEAIRNELLQTKKFAGVTGEISINEDGSVTKPLYINEWNAGKVSFVEKLEPQMLKDADK